MSNRFALSFALLLLVGAASLPAAGPALPEPLQPWRDWVLHGHEQLACPFLYDRVGERRCAWPGELQVELELAGAAFVQDWRVYAATEVGLPGDDRLWPQGVTVDGEPAPLLERDGRPLLRLEAGEHRVAGRLPWSKAPETLPVPPDTGLVTVLLAGRPLPRAELDREGRLWLRAPDERPATTPERLELRVFRRLADEVPARLETRLELDVAGEQRELLLGHALPEGFIPLRLDSPLPARLEPDGRLRLQVRPGRWSVTLEARHDGPLATATVPGGQPGPWPAQEVWVFDARTWLRLVDVEGVVGIDPRQTELPAPWRRLPAFLLNAGDSMTLVERRRGDPDPAPDRLHLERELWLDFDGRGYTVRDDLDGTVSRSRRLEAAAPLQLGRVAIDGEPRFVTRLDAQSPTGVEVRPGPLRLEALGRLDGAVTTLPAVGWRHDVDALTATVHLPPGWELLDAAGADRVSRTWLQRWTLLDLFLVLVTALAAARLWGPAWGALALLTLVLTWHEPWAPRWVWLALLAVSALLRVLPQGRLHRLTGLLRTAVVVTLAVIALPFMVFQVRAALYPALQQPAPAPTLDARVRSAAPAAPLLEQRGKALDSLAEALPAPPPPPRYDPDTRVQTGPGLPRWHGQTVRLDWDGPVAAGRRLHLYLLPPYLSRPLALLRAVLVALLAAGLLGVRPRRQWRPSALRSLLPLALLPALFAPERVDAAEFPPPQLLQDLEARLTEAPPCAPLCASSPLLHLGVDAAGLRLVQTVHAAHRVAVPLPARAGQWLPRRVTDNGTPVGALFRDGDGGLWLALTAGVHEVVLEGPLPARAALQVPLPLRPHRVEYRVDGWQVVGVNADGSSDRQLELRRLGAAAEPSEALQPGALPPFLRVERHLELGLSWRVTTRVERENPAGEGTVVTVPLLPGESVTSGHVPVVDGAVRVSLPPQRRAVQWQSVLEPSGRLRLQAPAAASWVELWRVTVSPLWHAEFSGPPPVRPPDAPAHPLQWRPWPGEELAIDVSRPLGVPGNTVTVERSALHITPGAEHVRATLDLTLRSSGGGHHPLSLPPEAELQGLRVDGRDLPLPRDAVSVPLVPGEQEVTVEWLQPGHVGMRYATPTVDAGAPGANARLELTVPAQRWVLYAGGPLMGPAVLFWGVLAVLAAAAWALGRTGLAPLRGRHWFLLAVGLSQVPVQQGVVVVLWLLALGARCRLSAETRPLLHNAAQVLLVPFTLAALVALYGAIEQGLLGTPAMQVTGNGSYGNHLVWFADRFDGELPQARVLSLPMWVYRALMLAWALWLANAFIGWLRWGWGCFARGGLWRTIPWRLPRRPTPSAPTGEA